MSGKGTASTKASEPRYEEPTVLLRMNSATKTLALYFFLALSLFRATIAIAEALSGATLGNLTGPVDTRFMPDHHLYDVIWGNEKFVVVGGSALDETEVLLSPDGASWERVSLGKPSRPLGFSSVGAGSLYSVAWNGSVFVAVGERILTSSDGKSWNVTATFAPCVLSRIIAQNGQFVAVGGDRGRGCIATSTDGRVWTDRTAGIETNTSSLSGVAWNGATFVAVGATTLGRLGVSSVLLSSPDGVQWRRQAGPAEVLVDVAWGRNLFVTVGGAGRQGAVFTSPDLHEWTERTPQRSQRLRAVLWSGSFFVAIGEKGSLFSSTDGLAWSERQAPAVNDLLSVAYHNSLFVAVGDGVILTSADGVQWRVAGRGE